MATRRQIAWRKKFAAMARSGKLGKRKRISSKYASAGVRTKVQYKRALKLRASIDRKWKRLQAQHPNDSRYGTA